MFLTPTPDTTPINHVFCLLAHNAVHLRPFLRRVLVLDDALDATTCDTIIAECEAYAAANGGWTSNRHSGYPTTDLPLDAVFGRFSPLSLRISEQLLPAMAKFFDLDVDALDCAELFVAKYEYKEGAQRALGAHVDGTPFSFVVALNDPSTAFDGGGTRFTESGVTYRPARQGSAVIFSGKNEHEGVAVTGGTRYILTGFCSFTSTDRGHATFLAGYDRVYDGSAATAQTVRGSSGRSREGIHTGDVLRGIRVYSRRQGDGDAEADGGTLISLDGLTTPQVQQVVRDCGRLLGDREVTVLIEPLLDEEDGGDGNGSSHGGQEMTDLHYEQLHIRKMAGSLLNKGKFMSFDYFLTAGRE